MKTAIYIEDGVVQLVLTPETEFEKNAIGSFEDKDVTAKIMVGGFYNCNGGWVRHNICAVGNDPYEERSLIIKNTISRK